MLATGRDDPVGGLPLAYSHRPDELAGELADAGLVDVRVVGVEGPGWTLFTPGLPSDAAEALLDSALAVARLCDGHPDPTAASAHLFAFGRRA